MVTCNYYFKFIKQTNKQQNGKQKKQNETKRNENKTKQRNKIINIKQQKATKKPTNQSISK